ncbi:MAG: secondary thiamine-phosphate synthase enzyme YjbQ [Anaerolineaceae bacterium]|nr:secondary thiamine-phosphate synthase enzyme YjbQ [Anaerolineaceae bacterium]
MVQTHMIRIATKGNADVLDVTGAIETAIASGDIQNGIVTVFCPSSTSAVTTIEYEPGCVSDLRRLFDEILNPGREYAHNARWGDGNGHSHARAALLGPSLTVPFNNKKLTLGTWQQIVFIDFDIRARQRELALQVLGE